VLAAVVPYLACPHCAAALTTAGATLRCAGGHSFDIARQGYVTLLPAGRPAPSGDTAAMLAARERFLAARHFAPLTARLAATAAAMAGPDGCVVDIGAGTGHQLAATLELMPGHVGVALDASRYAARRAARAHPRAGAVVCDAWRRLPVVDGAAAVVLDVFAPRNGPEMRRIMRPDGALMVGTPAPDHLGELVAALGLVTVDERKAERLAGALEPGFSLVDRSRHRQSMALSHVDIEAVAAMGPSAWHVDPGELASRVATLPEPMAVTTAVDISVYRPAGR
jgi:23S rRNA (guanine745-N1)-methyltransferase